MYCFVSINLMLNLHGILLSYQDWCFILLVAYVGEAVETFKAEAVP